MRLAGKIGIVTAAASGMGRAGALRFAVAVRPSRDRCHVRLTHEAAAIAGVAFNVVTTSPSCFRRNNRARCTRVFTTGTLRPSISAISTFDSPSTSRSTSIVRETAGNSFIAAVSASRSSIRIEGSSTRADQSAVSSTWRPRSSKSCSTSSRGTLDAALPCAEFLVRRIGDDAVQPGAEGQLTPEGIDLPDHAPERVLHDLLGVLFVSGDPRRQGDTRAVRTW